MSRSRHHDASSSALSRRAFLGATAATAAALGLPLRALGDVPASGRSFLFVFATGGWDTTRVLAPVFDNPEVDLEPDAEPATLGGIRFVDHPGRPAVRSFFERHHSRCLVLNGIEVPSVQHEVCTQLVLTGANRAGEADWATRIGDAAANSFTLPHLVLGGPSFPGPYPASVARTGANGQLEALLSGRISDEQLSVARLSGPAESLIDRWLARRAGAAELAARTEPSRVQRAAFRQALERATALKDLRYTTDFSTTPDLQLQAEVAIEALSQGVSRCASIVDIGGDNGWDTHAGNDVAQSVLHDSLYDGLDRIMALLDATPGRSSATLAQETVVVVMSEMGRTPKLNAVGGKDHWPTTSALLIGPGLTTDRVVGAYDDGFFGARIDPRSGAVSSSGVALSTKMLGATLLAVAGVDPEASMPGVPVLDTVIV